MLLINLINPNLPAVIFFKSGKSFLGKNLGSAKSGALAIKEINRLKKERAFSLGKIKIFAALSGPSSFSGIRSEMAIVNSLATALKKPIVIINEEEINDLGSAASIIIRKQKKKIALPVYDREPNITISKKQSNESTHKI